MVRERKIIAARPSYWLMPKALATRCPDLMLRGDAPGSERLTAGADDLQDPNQHSFISIPLSAWPQF
jgi:hypothetical protein